MGIYISDNVDGNSGVGSSCMDPDLLNSTSPSPSRVLSDSDVSGAISGTRQGSKKIKRSAFNKLAVRDSGNAAAMNNIAGGFEADAGSGSDGDGDDDDSLAYSVTNSVSEYLSPSGSIICSSGLSPKLIGTIQSPPAIPAAHATTTASNKTKVYKYVDPEAPK